MRNKVVKTLKKIADRKQIPYKHLQKEYMSTPRPERHDKLAQMQKTETTPTI